VPHEALVLRARDAVVAVAVVAAFRAIAVATLLRAGTFGRDVALAARGAQVGGARVAIITVFRSAAALVHLAGASAGAGRAGPGRVPGGSAAVD